MTHSHTAPDHTIRYFLDRYARLDQLLDLPSFSHLSSDLAHAIITEAASFSNNHLAPLNTVGDQQGCLLKDNQVQTPQGFKEAYTALVANGWNTMSFPSDYGGQGLPQTVSTIIAELFNSCNMAFALCPMLTQGAAHLLEHHGNDALKTKYLPKLVSGEYSGTMCLTEPQAGSDVGALTTQATAHKDHYLIKGQKIYITYGDHDWTGNIIHMVLARLPGAPKGSKGISLFLVPKYLEDGSRNDVKPIGIEHKLGIHASPTCTMAFGEDNTCIGYLIGEEHKGLACMFTMMNHARLNVGIEGLGVAENAYQKALTYAKERIQTVPIIEHGDVKRQLMHMRAQLDGLRALTYYTAFMLDMSQHASSAEEQARCLSITNWLIPIVKAHGTDLGFSLSSDAMQVFGGLGYIEETGIAQNLRDARIAMIYEGTNGIQAMDLLIRKTITTNGQSLQLFLKDLEGNYGPNAQKAKDIEKLLIKATKHMQALHDKDASLAAFKAYPYLQLLGITASFLALLSNTKQGLETPPDLAASLSYYEGNILSTIYGLEKTIYAASSI